MFLIGFTQFIFLTVKQVNDYPIAVQHLNYATGNYPYRIMIAYGGWTTCGRRVLVMIHAEFLNCYIRNKTPQGYVIIFYCGTF